MSRQASLLCKPGDFSAAGPEGRNRTAQGKAPGLERCDRRALKGRAKGLVVLALATIAAGCQIPAHHEARQQAEQRWSEVRARVKLQLGRQQYEGGVFEEAAATLAEAAALDSKQPETFVLLARANLELGHPASAQKAVDAARAAGLDTADLHYTQAVILEQRGDLDAAIAEYRQARTLDAGQVDYVIALAECLVSAHREAEAAQLLEESVHDFDESASIAALAGHVAQLMGDAERAATYFGQAVVDAADDPVLAQQLGLLLARIGRCEQAVAVLRPIATSSESDCGAIRRALAQCEMSLGDPIAARTWLLGYVPDHPRDIAAQSLLAQACIEADDLKTADIAIQAVERRDASAGALLRAAWHWQQAEYPAAAGILYDLLERVPTNADAYHLLCAVLERQNQPDAAQDCLDRAAQLAPGTRR